MSVIATTILYSALSASGGIVFGSLWRQPQINKQKEQIKKLHDEISKCHDIIKKQNIAFEILKVKYDVASKEELLNTTASDKQDVAEIKYMYCLQEYIRLKHKFLIKNETITEEEGLFIDAFSRELDGTIINEENGAVLYNAISEFIEKRYKKEIDKLIIPDLQKDIEELDDALKMNGPVGDFDSNEIKNPLALNHNQTSIMYSLMLKKIEIDIKKTKKEEIKLDKIVWKNRWVSAICDLLKDNSDNKIFLNDTELFNLIKTEHEKHTDHSWWDIILLEAALFSPYFYVEEYKSKKEKKDLSKLKLEYDWIISEYNRHQTYTEEKTLCNNIKCYKNNMKRLDNFYWKLAGQVVSIVALSATVGGLASVFAGKIAIALVGSKFASLSGAALTKASLACIGGGALSVGGAGMAGGTLLITGGGALLGLASGGVSSAIASLALLSNNKFVLQECAKLETTLIEIVINKEKNLDGAKLVLDDWYEKICNYSRDITAGELDKEDNVKIKNMKKSLKYMRASYERIKEASK